MIFVSKRNKFSFFNKKLIWKQNKRDNKKATVADKGHLGFYGFRDILTIIKS